MCEGSNPAFSSLTKTVAHGQADAQHCGQGQMGADFGDNPYQSQVVADYRPTTVDDVVSKIGITLATIIVLAAVNFFIAVSVSTQLAMVLTTVGATGGLITILASTFGKKYGSTPVTLTYAAFEGFSVSGISLMFIALTQGVAAGTLIMQAVLTTLGAFADMFFVYKSGVICVTPKFTRFMSAALIGILVLMLGNLMLSLFGLGFLLRDGGMLSIISSPVYIGLTTFSFLIDFDQADRLVRAGALAQYAWSVAPGLAATLVWLYTEILRLLSYSRD